jgi:hypothetical protein
MTDDAITLKNAVASLAGKQAPVKTLADRASPAALPAKVGAGKMRLSGSAPSGSGGVSGPFIETDSATRTYHPTASLVTSDGLFTFIVRPVETFGMQDGTGRAFDFTLDA